MALLSLSIKNLAVIEAAEIDFETGLTVITGETGAGKSVILKALALMLGSRADNALIRHGQETCNVYADFALTDLEHVQEWLTKNDFDDDNNCIIRRVIKRDKGSKTYINGHPANLSQLKLLGSQLIDLHGQHEHQQLLNKAHQLKTIDALAAQDHPAHNQYLNQLKGLYSEIKALKEQAKNAQSNAEENSAKLDLLIFQVQELDDLEVSDNEFSEVNAEYSKLSNAQELLDGYQAVQFDLSENDEANIESILGRCNEKIIELKAFDPELKNAANLLSTALANIQEASQDIRLTANRTELDPERLHFLEQRLNSLIDIARKHRCKEDTLGSLHEQLSIELNALKQQIKSPESLDKEISALTNKFNQLAIKVSTARSQAGRVLEKHVSEQMQLLGMTGGKFEVHFHKQDSDTLTATGIDNIEFLSSGNPGMPVQPLNKVASGGELSRISLAIQILEGSVRRAPTLIFDEVDVGVGGGTAEIVGNSLKALAQSGQVLCITHLPQVAAKGDQHLSVNKDADESSQITSTNICMLNKNDRVQEIARMLGGIDITQNTLAHAQEMLG